MKRIASHLLTCAALCLLSLQAQADETVEVHGILEETQAGVILVTDASAYVIRGIDASGLDGNRAIVLGDQGEDNGIPFIDAREIKIAQ